MYHPQMLSGWGLWPGEHCNVSAPETFPTLVASVLDSTQPDLIARGLGRAYGDSALNRSSGVIVQTGRNAFLSFDPIQGVVECEAGVSLAEIIEHLQPRGWFLPTTPGTKFVTLGGAIAADVHGKNHHCDGSFGRGILDLKLMVADGSVVNCSTTVRPDLFWATVGGMGLTGIILSARVQLVPIETAYYNVCYRRTRNLDESLECFADADTKFRFSVAWIDCLARGKSLGRSVMMLADHARRTDLTPRAAEDPLRVSTRRCKTVPFHFPSFVLNSLSARAFNSFYYMSHPDRQVVVDYDTFFYPLDGVRHWNRIYGRRGFVQYQALFPTKTSRSGLIELLERVASSRQASFLAVLKRSGSASPGMLSYLFPGHTLALDFPRSPHLELLTRDLDKILLRHGGRLYLAKDSVMSPETFHQMYPRLDEFRAVKEAVDPGRRFLSSQAKRLEIFAPDRKSIHAGEA